VAVDWTDDPDSRVDIVRTALADLRGVARLLLQTPVARFIAIGIVSTLAYALLYLTLRPSLAATTANAVALALTAVANTLANRRFTFDVHGRAGLLSQLVAGTVVYVITLALTEGALQTLPALDPRPGKLIEVVVLVIATAFATLTRYFALKAWVFRRRAGSIGVGDHRADAFA
jgi:putative flippase GtrA